MEREALEAVRNAASTLESVNARLTLLMDALTGAKPQMGSEGLAGMYFVLDDTKYQATAAMEELRGLLDCGG